MATKTCVFAVLLAISTTVLCAAEDCDCPKIVGRQVKIAEEVGKLFEDSTNVEASCSQEERIAAGTYMFEFMAALDHVTPCQSSYPEPKPFKSACEDVNKVVSQFQVLIEEYTAVLKKECECGCKMETR